MKTKQKALDWWKSLDHINKKQATNIYFNGKREYNTLDASEITVLYLEFT